MAGGPWNTEEDEPPPSGAAAGRLLIWLAALAACLVFLGPISAAGMTWLLWTCVAGIALGLAGILYTHYRQK